MTTHAPGYTPDGDPDRSRTLCGRALVAFGDDVITPTVDAFDETPADDGVCWECSSMT